MDKFWYAQMHQREALLRWANSPDTTVHNTFSQFTVGSANNSLHACSIHSKCMNQKISYDNDFFTAVSSKENDFYEFKDLYTWTFPSGRTAPSHMMDEASYKKIYTEFQEIVNVSPQEIGGSFDVRDGVLYLRDDIAKGGQRTINIPEAPYEFHIHPNKCERTRQCALGFPSTTDLMTILHRQYNCGNEAHLVFAFEGVFVCFANPEFIGHNDPPPVSFHDARQDLEGVIRQIDSVVSNYLKHEDYVKARIEWMKLVNSDKSPLRVYFFPLNKSPCVPPRHKKVKA